MGGPRDPRGAGRDPEADALLQDARGTGTVPSLCPLIGTAFFSESDGFWL